MEGNIEEFSVLGGMLTHPLVQAPVFGPRFSPGGATCHTTISK